ncbi:MAG: hypothetical protein UY22_C0043G0013 [Candidatus Amesbacteria bacterium GW2011_GWC1_48_10]|uniref:Uncharacterized protein n=2 Tax=Patescibacteria group TaxID=1783273 RepID=A0A0G1UBA4_9BACT|nr:MAG: hypothetical protein UY22_C0043G0013 [Candidatus Amesbacteria bacterium GW2011_GWC1_48_10]KKW22760.1 MAG: hypothetical protein UY67_C0036G0010 [Candidatus Kaiserbacteria bacterium GW2011_GWA2_52_12]
MENEFKTCPNCGELGEWIDVRTERVFGEDPGTMYVHVMHCNLCNENWNVNYLFEPDPL